MTMTLFRPALASAVLAGVLLLSPTRAEAAFAITAVRIYRMDTSEAKGTLLASSDLLETFFDKARCDCQTPMRVEIEFVPDTSSSNRLTVYAGTDCFNTSDKKFSSSCRQLVEPVRIDTMESSPRSIYVSASDLMVGRCTDADRVTLGIHPYMATVSDENWAEQTPGNGAVTYTVDTEPPTAPTAKTVEAGENQVKVSFTSPNDTSSTGVDGGGTSTTDRSIIGFQVLCARSDNGAAALSGPPDPAYTVAANLSNASCPARSGTTDAGATDAAVTKVDSATQVDAGTLDAGARDSGAIDSTATSADSGFSSDTGVDSLAAAYVCSKMQSDTTLTVNGLENDVKYDFYVVSIDKARNPSTLTKVGSATPQKAEDLWERYKRSGGQSDGGYCFVATAAFGSYDHPQVRVLREFRDRVLLPSSIGQRVVIGYYRTGSAPAAWLSRHDNLRPLARAALWPVTFAAAAHLYTSPFEKALVLLVLAAAFLGYRHRRARALRLRGDKP